jgi:Subtilase family
MKIARADVTQTAPWNITGKLVHVAHWEWGPTDLSNLSFEGQYTSNPDPAFQGRPIANRMPNEKHARFTAGVIKNVEPGKPHGYAPDCKLYSANDTTDQALIWSLLDPQLCTVISKSFDRGTENASPWPGNSDWPPDICALSWPWLTIVAAAGNYPTDPFTGRPITTPRRYVASKSYNIITVGSHDDAGKAIMPWSIYENPNSPNGDRELPHICANGDSVALLGESHLVPLSLPPPSPAQ